MGSDLIFYQFSRSKVEAGDFTHFLALALIELSWSLFAAFLFAASVNAADIHHYVFSTVTGSE